MAFTTNGESLTLRSSAVNLNSTGDVVSFTNLPASIVVDKVEFKGWSTTPGALLAATLRDTAAGAGNSLVGAIAGLNSIVTSTELTATAFPFVSVLGATRVVTTGSLFLNVSVANGSALTGDVIVFYHVV